MTAHRPLKVTAQLAGPLAGEAPHLDAVLQWAMMVHLPSIERARGGASPLDGGQLREHLDRRTAAPAEDEVPLPLARRWVGNAVRRYVSLCSSPILPRVESDGHEHIAKRFPTELAPLLTEAERTVVAVGNGTYKSYRLPLRVRVVPQVVWFCVGDRRDIKARLRKQVRSLGKKVSDGYGRVAEWDIEDAAEDWSWFATSPAGPVLMRPMPADADLPAGLLGGRRDFGACSPPYWHPDRYGDVVVPC